MRRPGALSRRARRFGTLGGALRTVLDRRKVNRPILDHLIPELLTCSLRGAGPGFRSRIDCIRESRFRRIRRSESVAQHEEKTYGHQG